MYKIIVLFFFLTAGAFASEATVGLFSGYNDNIYCASSEKTGALFLNPSFALSLGNNNFHFDFDVNPELYFTTGMPGDVEFGVGPGVGFSLFSDFLAIDLSYMFSYLSSFSLDTDYLLADPNRTQQLQGGASMNLGPVEIRPQVSYSFIDYFNIGRFDKHLDVEGLILVDLGNLISIGASIGRSDTNSDVLFYSKSGPTYSALVSIGLTDEITFFGAYDIRKYSFGGSTITEDQKTASLNAEFQISKNKAFNISFSNTNNDSNYSDSDYSANLFKVGFTSSF